MPRFEDLDLDAQLDMPVTYKRELLARPPELRGPDATNLAGEPCPKYYRQTDPNTGRVKWSTIPGANCSRAAIEASKPTPPTAKPVTPRVERPETGPVTVCGNASFWINKIGEWRPGMATDQPTINTYIQLWREQERGAYTLCPRWVTAVNNEIDRLIRIGGGSRSFAPIAYKIPIQLLNELLDLRDTRYTPKNQQERDALNAGREVLLPPLYQRIVKAV